MKTWWLRTWDHLLSSFWFIPGGLAVASAVLATGLMVIDHRLGIEEDGPLAWLKIGDAESARSLLSAILTAIIPVMTVVLSITVVALTLASNQFGPRMLRSFMENRGTQLAMGVFIGTGVYCMLVLGAIGRFATAVDAPHLASLGAVALGLLSLGVLVYFIHHIALSIQAPQVVHHVAQDIDKAIRRWFPHAIDQPDDEGPDVQLQQRPRPPRPLDEARTITCQDDGYLQTVGVESLLALAEKHDLLLHLPVRPGDFVLRGQVIAHAWPAARVSDAAARRIRREFTVGSHRTPTQDVEFAIDQLVEIAVRALSPSLNDPVTATTCVDRLSQGLCSLAARRITMPHRRDASGELRLVTAGSSYRGMVDTAFDKLRQHARRDESVTLRLLEAIGRIAPYTRLPEQRDALRRQLQMIHRAAMEHFPEASDRSAANGRYEATIAALDAAPDTPADAGCGATIAAAPRSAP